MSALNSLTADFQEQAAVLLQPEGISVKQTGSDVCLHLKLELLYSDVSVPSDLSM